MTNPKDQMPKTYLERDADSAVAQGGPYDTQGRWEGLMKAEIADLRAHAAALAANLGLARLALEQKAVTLASCEAALAQRDERVTALTAKCALAEASLIPTEERAFAAEARVRELEAEARRMLDTACMYNKLYSEAKEALAARQPVTWIDPKRRPPEPGLIVKHWQRNGSTVAIRFTGNPKMASCDLWLPLPDPAAQHPATVGAVTDAYLILQAMECPYTEPTSAHAWTEAITSAMRELRARALLSQQGERAAAHADAHPPLDVEFKRLADTILQATTNGARLEALRGMAELFDKRTAANKGAQKGGAA